MLERFFGAIGWARNALDFPLRQALHWRRSGVKLQAEAKDDLFLDEALDEVRRLVRTYKLEDWQQRSGRIDFAASLFYLQMLERALTEAGVRLPESVHALDAGCGDWFYVPALHGLLSRCGGDRSVRLDGVELDAYAMYAGFHSRRDWAEAFAAGLPGVTYLPMDIREYTDTVDIAFMLFPFLFERDARRWGLPRRYLRPAELLAHVAGRVRPGGVLVIANLGAAERETQHRLLAEAGLPIAWWGRHESLLFKYEQERYVTVIFPRNGKDRV